MRRWAAAVAIFVAACRVFAQAPTSAEILEALNAERARMDLEPLGYSAPLERLAQARADEITAGEVLDFEPASSADLFAAARSLGYDGTLVQELTGVGGETGCEIVATWNGTLGLSDVYRRPEARQIGVGSGVLEESAFTVLVVGVPVSHDALRKRWPGNVPREWLTAELLRELVRRRVAMGLPPFAADEPVEAEAQRQADALLGERIPVGAGRRETRGGTVLYYRTGPMNAAAWGKALAEWLAKDHRLLAVPGSRAIGAGLASHGREDYVDAVWTLLVAKGAP